MKIDGPVPVVELKKVDIQSSCISRELLVNELITPLPARTDAGNAVAPATAKLTPLLKSESFFKYGFRNGRPASLALEIGEKKIQMVNVLL